jgi:hypothetical protein
MKRFIYIVITFSCLFTFAERDDQTWSWDKDQLVNNDEYSEESVSYEKLTSDLPRPDTQDLYDALELEIDNKLKEIQLFIVQGEYSKALQKAKKLRFSVRQKLVKKPRGKKQEITINISRGSVFEDTQNIVLDFMGGYFIDLLNLNKRVEMFYTYAYVKRVSNGSELDKRDLQVLRDALVEVYDSKIKIINTKTLEENMVFESDIVDIHGNLLFLKELDSYFSDLGVTTKDKSSLLNYSEERKSQDKSLFQTQLLSKFEGQCRAAVLNEYKGEVTPSQSISFCNGLVNPKIIPCLVHEIDQISSKYNHNGNWYSHDIVTYRSKVENLYPSSKTVGPKISFFKDSIHSFCASTH